MPSANQTRRYVMLTAWSFRRSEPGRAFADCLRGAWRWIKGMAADAAKFMKRARKAGGVVRYSADLTRSPIHQANKGVRHGNRKVYEAAYMTARLGY